MKIPVRDYHDLAEILTEQFNGLANASEDFYPIQQDFVYEHIGELFDENDVDYMVDDDFSRGVIMGIIYSMAMSQVGEGGLEIEGLDGSDT